MTTTIELKRHRCNNPYIVRSGEKSGRSQNYLCNARREHFISGLERTYRRTASYTVGMVKIMPVRGAGIRGV
ncbi:MAG: hypothetical protein LBH43_21820, partial [Treponema sp.]|nr:hypothetical protein [Treponema sp.]